jgi:hypothetical protein
MHREKILETFQALKAAGLRGFTIDADGNEYEATRGDYAVGFQKYESPEEAVADMEPDLFLGFWVTEDGHECVNTVQIFHVKFAALITAYVRGEAAIYDFANDTLIFCDSVAKEKQHEESQCSQTCSEP